MNHHQPAAGASFSRGLKGSLYPFTIVQQLRCDTCLYEKARIIREYEERGEARAARVLGFGDRRNPFSSPREKIKFFYVRVISSLEVWFAINLTRMLLWRGLRIGGPVDPPSPPAVLVALPPLLHLRSVFEFLANSSPKRHSIDLTDHTFSFSCGVGSQRNAFKTSSSGYGWRWLTSLQAVGLGRQGVFDVPLYGCKTSSLLCLSSPLSGRSFRLN